MSSGYVYILSNKSMPGLLKIGRSMYGGGARGSELYTTGVPSEFTLEFEVFVKNMEFVERSAHNKLSTSRLNNSREFFEVTTEEAIAVIVNEIMLEYSVCNPEEAIAIESCMALMSKIGDYTPAVFHAIELIDKEEIERKVIEWRGNMAARKIRCRG